jgi:hypothetical protein
MTILQDHATAASRLRHALLAFQTVQNLLLAAHRKAKRQASPADVERFWAVHGLRLEAEQRVAAVEVMAGFKVFSAAGLVADASDQHLVTQAQRHLAKEQTRV